ncbi:hypothetical protein YPPY03_4619, partial [Yersinia pestis PY-03]
MCLYLIYCHFL